MDSETILLRGSDCRDYFRAIGLSYSNITPKNIDLLHEILEDNLCKYWDKEMRMKVSEMLKKECKFNFKTGLLEEAYLKVDGSYFKKREAISFNKDGFIGFAGWASSDNSQAIMIAFKEWCDEITDPTKDNSYP